MFAMTLASRYNRDGSIDLVFDPIALGDELEAQGDMLENALFTSLPEETYLRLGVAMQRRNIRKTVDNILESTSLNGRSVVAIYNSDGTVKIQLVKDPDEINDEFEEEE